MTGLDTTPDDRRSEEPRDRSPRKSRRGPRVAGFILLGIVALLMLLAGVISWIALTSSGTRWAAGQAVSRLPALGLEHIDGALGRGLTLRGLRFEPQQGTRIAVALVRVDMDLGTLWRRALLIEGLHLEGVRVLLAESPDDEEPKQPFSLEPPLDLIVARAGVTDATIADATGTLAHVRRATLRGRWTRADGLEVEQLRVAAREGLVRLEGRLGGAPGQWHAKADANIRWQLGARTYATTARIATDAAAQLHFEARATSPVKLRVDGVFDQEAREWKAALRVPAFDVRSQLLPDAPVGVVATDLRATGTDQTAALRGQVILDDDTVQIEALRLALEAEPRIVRLERLALRLNDEPGLLEATGVARLDKSPVTAKLEAQWRDLELPEAWVGQALSTSGRLAAQGSQQNYEVDGRLKVGPPGDLADVRFAALGTPRHLSLAEFTVQHAGGRLDANGTLDLQPQRGWSLEARARDFDPGVVLANWPGRLHLDLSTRGVMEPDGARGTIALDAVRGKLRDRRIEGSGRLDFALPASIAGTLQLRSGDSNVRIEAAPGDTLDARALLRVDIGDFVPGSRGRVNGDVRVRGRWPDVRISGRVDGRELGIAETRIARVRIDADVRNPTDPDGEITVVARDIVAGALRFEEVRADTSGTRAQHRLSLRAIGDPIDLATSLKGSLAADDSWSGRVEGIELGLQDDLRLDLQSPVSVEYVAGAVEVEETCLLLTPGEASRICASFANRADGTLRADYRLRDVPLSLARLALPDTLPGDLDGSLAGEGQVRRAADGLWFGELALASDSARILWKDDGPAAVAGQQLLIYENLRLEGRLQGARANARVTADIGGAGSLVANLRVDSLDEATPRLAGRVEADLPTLAPVAPFVPQVAGLQGRVEVDARLAGTTVEPVFTGFARAAGLAGAVPLLGIELQAGTLSAESRPDEQIKLAGSVRSGRGELRLDGTATRTGEIDATIRGRRFVAADLEGARVIVAPDLRFARSDAGMELTGEVGIEEAKINLQRLPQANPGARSVSSDVVIVNEPPPTVADEAGTRALPLAASVTVRLNDDAVELTGFGLDATVDGQLTVRDVPGREMTASGEVLVSGTYKAYGQDLTIREGQVLYAGTPIDNPRLRIEAVREVEDVVAGLRITGSAQDPQIDVFSDPTLGETDALAYLVTGRPMSSIGTAGEGDQDLMQEASQSLGTAAGGLLAKRLGQRLGIDEFGIAESEEIGGAALTIGQYLSPRLYVGFGVGLFDPGQIVTLRYDVSNSVSVEAVTSDETTRAGVDYRIER